MKGYCLQGFIHLTETEKLICYWDIWLVIIIMGIGAIIYKNWRKVI